MSPRPVPIIIPGPTGMGGRFKQTNIDLNLKGLVDLYNSTIGKSKQEQADIEAVRALGPLLGFPGEEPVPEGVTMQMPEGGTVNAPREVQKTPMIDTIAQSEPGRKSIFEALTKLAGEGGKDPKTFSSPAMYQTDADEYRWGYFNDKGSIIRDLRKATDKEIKSETSTELDKPLSASDVQKLVDPKTGEKPALGITMRQAIAKGLLPLTAAQETQKISADSTNEVLDKTESLVKKAGLSKNAYTRITNVPRLYGALYSQSDANVVQLVSYVNGTLAPIIRALGEKGTLAEGDVERAMALMPSLRDTEEIALQKIKNIREVIGNIKIKTTGIDSGEKAAEGQVEGLSPRAQEYLNRLRKRGR